MKFLQWISKSPAGTHTQDPCDKQSVITAIRVVPKVCCVSGLLTLLSLGACTETKQSIPTSNDLTGNWAGTYETQQAGSCSWSGPLVTATATFQVVNNTLTATISQIVGQTVAPAQFTGTVNGNAVSISKTNNARCNGTPRTYVGRFDGTISGNTLTMVSRDTVCPAQGCIFQRTLKLTRQ
jgi:hypothetical protein